MGKSSQGIRRIERTDRDLRALRFMTEQYGLRLDELSVLLQSSREVSARPLSIWGVRQQVERWKVAGWVRSEVVLGSTWVTPTPIGMAQVGLRFPIWRMPVTKLAHCHALNVVRLWYEASPSRVAQQGQWLSERLMFRDRGNEDWHVPDAALVPRSGSGVWAVEVELTPKHRPRYSDEVFARLQPDVAGVLYLCPPALVERIRRDVTSAAQSRRPGLQVFVRALPEVAGLTYGGHGGIW